jgi:hypothetical protein
MTPNMQKFPETYQCLVPGVGFNQRREPMKKLIILASVLSLSFGLGSTSYAQGTIVFNNLGTNNGLVFTYPDRFGGTPALLNQLNQDVNFALLAGPPGGPLMLEHQWLLSDGSAKGINVGPGRFADPSASVFSISGVAPGAAANVQVLAWGGNYNSLGAAIDAGAGFGLGLVFTMGAGSVAAPPASLVGMPQLDIFGIPEPRSLGLMVIGGIALGFCAAGRFAQEQRHKGARTRVRTYVFSGCSDLAALDKGRFLSPHPAPLPRERESRIQRWSNPNASNSPSAAGCNARTLNSLTLNGYPRTLGALQKWHS